MGLMEIQVLLGQLKLLVTQVLLKRLAAQVQQVKLVLQVLRETKEIPEQSVQLELLVIQELLCIIICW